MVSLQTYNLMHILGLVLLFIGLTALWTSRFIKAKTTRKFDLTMAIIHGLGMALILVSGFGMLARLGLVQGLPTWVYVKLAIWFILGGSMVLAKRMAHLGYSLLIVWVFLVGAAGYIALFKPV